MRFRSIRAAAALALLFGILPLALAQMSPAQRFELAPDDQPLRDVFLATQPVTVFLKMAGDPVAVVRSRAPGKQISEPERRSIADSLRREQDAITPAIEAMGGTVVAKLQHAINGIKVRATRDQLACNGHGSDVSGTAAGFGVKDDGTTFRGPYDANTPNVKFRIGPGVAPRADVYAVRVFGCVGSTDVVVEAIDWAVEHGMQIISMSLGADFGPEDTADAEASEHAAEAGLIVVAAAGNAGQSVYFLGSPAAGDKTLAAAAMDSTATFPGATLTLNTGTKLTAQNNNAAALPSRSLPIFVLPDTATTGAEGVSLGCAESEYDPAKITGKLVVALRGVCARVDRAIFGQRHGAAQGVSILSTAIGPGNLGVRRSGTSMATPHVSGVAALALQAHPDWDAESVRLAIANTADASQLGSFQPKLGGSGLVQPFAATRTSVVARGTTQARNVAFALARRSRDFSGDARSRGQH